MSMFLLRRFLTFLMTLWGASVIVFVMLEVLPGDPALTILGVDAPDSAVAALRQELGLDRPAWERYGEWIAGISRWELGTSYTYKVPVSELVAARLEVTVPLALSAMLLASAVALSLGLYAASRHNRLGVWREDFVRTARAKGLPRRATLWRHVLRNALIPVVTIMGLMFANVMAGTIVIENVFTLPGVGRLIFDSISNRDLAVVKNVVLMLAGLVVVVNFIVDILYALIDPRIRVGG